MARSEGERCKLLCILGLGLNLTPVNALSNILLMKRHSIVSRNNSRRHGGFDRKDFYFNQRKRKVGYLNGESQVAKQRHDA